MPPAAAYSLFMPTTEAAAVLGLTARHVRNLVTAGQLHAFRPVLGGRKYLLYTEEVLAYAAAAQQPAAAAARANIARLRALVSGK